MAMTKQQGTALAGFLAMIIVGIFSSDSYVPSLPAITVSLHTTHELVKLTVTLYLLGLAFSPLIFGPFSDKHGRRPIILLGLVVSFLGALVCAVAPSIDVLIAARFVQACGISVSMGVGRAMISDVFIGKERARMGSYIGMFISIAPALAPTVGGYLQSAFGWRANFIFILMLLTIVMFWAFFKMPETYTELNKNAVQLKVLAKNYWEALRHYRFMCYALLSGIVFAGIIGYLAVSPFLYQTVLGLTPVEFGWLAFFMAAMIFVGSLVNARLVQFIDADKLITVGMGIALLSGVFMLIPAIFGYTKVWIVLLPFLLFIFGTQFVMSNTYALSMTYMTHMLGLTSALFIFVQMTISSLGSAAIAMVHSNNQKPLAWYLIILSVLGLGLLVKLWCRRESDSPNH